LQYAAVVQEDEKASIKVERTIDIFTSAGSLILMHHDAETLANDVATIRQLEIDCKLFQFEPVSQNLAHPERVRLMSGSDMSPSSSPFSSPKSSKSFAARKFSEDFEIEMVFDYDPPQRPTKKAAKNECILMVDPVSTGGNIAVEAASRGYPLVAVYDKIKAMDSFVSLETSIESGTRVDRTIDIFTSAGSLILMHHDAETLEKDIATIRKMETDCELFEFEPASILLGRPSGNLLSS